MQELMPGTSAEHGSSAKGSSSSQLKSWLSGLGKKGKGEVDEVRASPGGTSCHWPFCRHSCPCTAWNPKFMPADLLAQAECCDAIWQVQVYCH